MDRCKSRCSSLKRRATCGTKEERHAIGFPAATEDQIEARRAKERQYRATWTPGFKALIRKRKREKRASLTKEQRQAINKKTVAARHKRRAKATEEQKAKEAAQRNAYLRKKNAAMDDQQHEHNSSSSGCVTSAINTSSELSDRSLQF
jgi:hypothetical protein